MGRRKQHTLAQIKEMLIDEAESIILREGLEALSARKLCFNIGYTVGTLYMCYESMPEVILLVKKRTLQRLTAKLEEFAPEDSPEQALRQQADAYLEYAQQHFNCIQILFSNSDATALPDWYREQMQALLQPLAANCQKLAVGRSDSQSRLAASNLFAAIHGLCLIGLSGHFTMVQSGSVHDNLDLLLDNFIRGWQIPQVPADAKPPKKSPRSPRRPRPTIP